MSFVKRSLSRSRSPSERSRDDLKLKKHKVSRDDFKSSYRHCSKKHITEKEERNTESNISPKHSRSSAERRIKRKRRHCSHSSNSDDDDDDDEAGNFKRLKKSSKKMSHHESSEQRKKHKKHKKEKKKKKRKKKHKKHESSSSEYEKESDNKEGLKDHVKTTVKEVPQQLVPTGTEPTTNEEAGTLLGPSPRVLKPMTKEEWEKQQSVIRRVFDPTTGRNRLVKGDGEILEEIVSKERHQQINKQATIGDGLYYQSKMGLNK
ncbi:ADP-ribosylation factor-like protein 6-interacting protein 4 [Argonauta hians]